MIRRKREWWLLAAGAFLFAAPAGLRADVDDDDFDDDDGFYFGYGRVDVDGDWGGVRVYGYRERPVYRYEYYDTAPRSETYRYEGQYESNRPGSSYYYDRGVTDRSYDESSSGNTGSNAYERRERITNGPVYEGREGITDGPVYERPETYRYSDREFQDSYDGGYESGTDTDNRTRYYYDWRDRYDSDRPVYRSYEVRDFDDDEDWDDDD